MIITHIISTVLTVLIAGISALILRRWLVKRLEKSVLDNWLVQTLGTIVVVLIFLLAVPILFSIWDIKHLVDLWNQYNKQHDIVGLIGNIAWSLALIVLAIGVARTAKKVTLRNLSENRVDINMRTLIGRILYIVTLAIAFFWILSIWQFSITIPVAILGTLTVAITFSIQDILKDLVAGLYILAERPFHIGDEITVPTALQVYTGNVKDVLIRATTLRLATGEEITIPNAQIFGSAIVNNSFYGEKRVTLSITLAQEAYSKQETGPQVLGILKEYDAIMPKPEPIVLLTGYTGDQITLTLRFWIMNGRYDTISDVMQSLRAALPGADLAVREIGWRNLAASPILFP